MARSVYLLQLSLRTVLLSGLSSSAALVLSLWLREGLG